MDSQITGLKVAAVIFGLMALGQAGRLATQPDIQVGGASMPLWPSAVALIVLLGLCLWLWRLAKPQ
ncbi:hypothetical protein FM996_10950 [Methylosinus sporium]|uniref:Uncharacterized protein n=1 Tax=Methylosinus sporium TaxID=428 RepID=A0A549SUY4_METSR|nr:MULTISPECIES: hypothetical protein [Methylosinus]MBU3890248.1 hypothetical protein [Methylosinus sp. KRF6]OAI25707.1 hypothetical protein A1351_15960 [Methylosinus sp. R-45379]TRL33387.1 hypothetical protein FM996_10950 [Methylosinus sporium]